MKYPKIGHDFQSSDLAGMYYAGTVTHSLDHRKSSGGFIHGFRYTARTLHRLLEWKNHQVAWPVKHGIISQLLPTIIKRINEASGPYQMFQYLSDIIIFRNDHTSFELLEEFPVELLHELPQHTGHEVNDMIVILLEYGTDFSGPGNDVFNLERATGDPSDAHRSNFLHPVFYYYRTLPTYEDMQQRGRKKFLPKPDAIHHIVEDFLTSWDAATSHILPLRRFLESILQHDSRQFFAENCFQMALMHQKPPHMCADNFLAGQSVMFSEIFNADPNLPHKSIEPEILTPNF